MNMPHFSMTSISIASMLIQLKVDKTMQINPVAANFIGSNGDFCWLRFASLVPGIPFTARKECYEEKSCNCIL